MAGGGPPSKVSIGASPRGSEGVGWSRKPIVRLKPAKPLDSQKVTPRPEKGFTRDESPTRCGSDNAPLFILIQGSPGKGGLWSSICWMRNGHRASLPTFYPSYCTASNSAEASATLCKSKIRETYPGSGTSHLQPPGFSVTRACSTTEPFRDSHLHNP